MSKKDRILMNKEVTGNTRRKVIGTITNNLTNLRGLTGMTTAEGTTIIRGTKTIMRIIEKGITTGKIITRIPKTSRIAETLATN